MARAPFDLVGPPSELTARVRARGHAVLSQPLLNRGTAFTPAQRRVLGLTGLLPDRVSTLDSQLGRVYGQYQRSATPLDKHVWLGNLRDRNEVLFYRLLTDYLFEMLPIVYTPTIGDAIERYSHEFRRPRGVYLSVDRPEEVEESFANLGLGPDEVDLVVATDGEGILGIGDWGANGAEIAIGKLAVYTAAAGIHPGRVIPVMLDAGTDNPVLLNDDMYLGVRHPRVRGGRYDELVEAYVSAVTKHFPDAMLHWEDFGADNARRLLHRYADRCATFNDDMQATAAVALAATLSALRIAGTRLADQRIVIHGPGTAGIGIADMLRSAMVAEGLSPEEATARFYPVGRRGLLTDDQAPSIRDFQRDYARSRDEVAGWSSDGDAITLADVVREAGPTILIGTSAQPGAFSEPIVRQMAAQVDRPVIMPLSNPTSKSEAAPGDLLEWTDGRALIATGSPFAPVERDGSTITIAQANNALIFPGVGLGVTVCRARRISDTMLTAAADAVARSVTGDTGDANTDDGNTESGDPPLLPTVRDLRETSAGVAVAVAQAAADEGLAGLELTDVNSQVRQAMWSPAYPAIEAIEA